MSKVCSRCSLHAVGRSVVNATSLLLALRLMHVNPPGVSQRGKQECSPNAPKWRGRERPMRRRNKGEERGEETKERREEKKQRRRERRLTKQGGLPECRHWHRHRHYHPDTPKTSDTPVTPDTYTSRRSSRKKKPLSRLGCPKWNHTSLTHIEDLRTASRR